MNKLFENKKGVSQVPGILIVFLTVVIIMGIVGVASVYLGDTVQDVRDDQTPGSIAEGIGNNSLQAQVDLSDKNDSIAGVVVAGIIIAVLLAAFGGFLGARSFR